MIKFFRHIRKSLLDQGKTSRYLKYAIGEIALVMIGILLALQVNNWNEERKNNLAFEKLITSFKDEIKSNINNANNNINRNYRLDSLLQLIINHKVDREMIYNDPSLLGFIGYQTTTIRFSDENLNILLNQKEDLPNRYEVIIKDLQLLKEFIESQKKWENILLDIVMENRKYNDLNISWLNKTDSLSISQSIDYLLHNPFYHNQLQTYVEIQFDENVYDMNNVRLVSLRLLKAIEDLQNGPMHQNGFEFVTSLGFNTSPNFSCNDSIVPLSHKASFRMYIPFYNTTQDTVTFYRLDEKGRKTGNPMKIAENTIRFFYSEIPEGEVLIQEKDGACVAKYQNRRNSVLLIQ